MPVQLNVWHKDSACPMYGLMYVWLWAWESGIARTATFDDVDVCTIQAILVVVNLNSDDYSDREIDIFSANQIPAF